MTRIRTKLGLIFAVLIAIVGMIAISGTASAGPRPASQLGFIDSRGDVYSIYVVGPNQNGIETQTCWQTPGLQTLTTNWWWAARTYIYLNRDTTCSNYIGYIYIDP